MSKEQTHPKYRLLKDLPNINSGEILKLSKRGTCYSCNDKNGYTATLSIALVESNPAWFELVEDKQWEIISVLADDGEPIYYPSKDVIDITLKNKGERIHSVKRLSDNVTFSVGDKIAWDWEDSIKSSFKITGFRVISDGIPTLMIDCDFTTQNFNAVNKRNLRIVTEPATPSIKEDTPVKERIEIVDELEFNYHTKMLSTDYPQTYHSLFHHNKIIPRDKFPAIKKAIEAALNKDYHSEPISRDTWEETDTVVEDKGGISLPNDYIDMSETELFVMDGKGNKFPLSNLYKKKYTQSEVDAIMKSAWGAARLKTFGNYNFTFLEDYLKSVPENKSSTEQPKEGKPVLFTTEDGVDIYDTKQEMWAIKKGKYELMEQHNGKWLGTWLNGWYTTQWLSNPKEKDDRILPLIKEHYLLFSTKEAAEQYILKNKPCLSANDIKWWLEKYFNYPDGINVNQLTELVKSKL